VRALADRLRDLWRARELLRQLVSKELKVRYKHSALGFAWSLLTPVLMTGVFTVVFGFIFRFDVEDFAAFFLAGYLVWSFFQNSVAGSVQAIVGNGSLIRKVYFPREVLPLANVVAQGVHFVLALLVISPYLVYMRGTQVLVHLPAVLLGIVLVTIFAAGLAMFFAALNVTFRDLQELIVVIFLVWFYATPVIYPYELAVAAGQGSTVGRLFLGVIKLNPMTWFVRLFREPLYGIGRVGDGASLPPVWPTPRVFIGCTVVALGAFFIGYVVFHRFAVTFAKEV
jgi:ABC-type polysaccharide/polyol phosphate export permease